MKIPCGKIIAVIAKNPVSVCDDNVLLASALLSVGVPQSRLFGFSITIEENGDKEWKWVFEEKSRCGTYTTAQLVKWWADDAWNAANPRHEWAIVRTVLRIQAQVAAAIRKTTPAVKITRGLLTAIIPQNASPALREFRTAQLEGRIPANATFTEPERALPVQVQ